MALEAQPQIAISIKSGTLGALNAALELMLNSVSTGTVQITGTWSGALTFEVSNDDFVTAYPAYFSSSSVGLTNTTTVNGNFRFYGLAGYAKLRVKMTGYVSGSALVTLSTAQGNSTQPVLANGFFQDGETPLFSKPLLIGGIDSATGVARAAKIDPSGNQLVAGPLTDVQLRASAIQVDVADEPARDLGKVDIASLDQYTPVAGRLPVDGSGVTLTTKDLKDSGRTQIMLSWDEVAGTAAAESALTNFTLGSKGGAALSAASSYTVTAGKILRIQAVIVYVKQTGTANNLARLRLRQAASSISNSSPVIFNAIIGAEVIGTPAAGLFSSREIPIPDGLEVAGGQQITATWFTSANTCVVGITVIGYEY